MFAFQKGADGRFDFTRSDPEFWRHFEQRILFGLNKDHSAIDLVCHADGRLRLTVNQWPDSVRNDSSPGKLQVGKWTFFAVTYDATQARENVSWYFSAPLAAPAKTDVALDRRTSHHAGPVGADIGPLAIGNFNQTMHGTVWTGGSATRFAPCNFLAVAWAGAGRFPINSS